MPEPASPDPGEAPEHASTWTRLGAYAARRAVRWAADVAILAGLLWVVASRGIGMGVVVPWALERFAPDGWTVHTGEVGGSWLSEIRLQDLALRDSTMSIRADEVRIDYAAWPLIHRDIRLARVRLVAPDIGLGSLDRTGREEVDTTEATSRAGTGENSPPMLERLAGGAFPAGWTLRVDDVAISDGQVRARQGGRAYRASDVTLDGHAAWAGTGLGATLDSLTLDLVVRADSAGRRHDDDLPGDHQRKADVPLVGRLSLEGGVSDGTFDLERLTFDSNHGRLTGSGQVPLVPASAGAARTELSLRGQELDLRYLPLALPATLADLPRLDFEVHLRDGHDSTVVVEAEAHARPVDGDVVAGDLSGRVDATLRSWSPEQLVRAEASLTRIPASDVQATGLLHEPLRLDASLEGGANGGSTGLAGMTASASLQHGSATVAGGDLDWHRAASVHADLAPDSARWDVDMTLDGASLDAQGIVTWASAPAELTVQSLQADAFDLRALSGSWPETSVTGRLHGRMTLTTVDSLRGRVSLALDSSSVGATAIDTLDLDVRSAPGSFRGTAELGRDSLGLRFAYDATLRDSLIHARVSELQLSSAPDTASDASSLEARGSADLRWRLGQDMRGTATVTLDSARAAGLRFRGTELDARLDGESFTGTAQARILDALAAPVALRASLDGHGFDPAAMQGTLDLELRVASDTVPVPIDSASATVTARGDERFDLAGNVSPSAGGRIRWSGRAVGGQDGWSLEADASGHVGDGDATEGPARADSLRLSASARRTSDAWREAALDFSSTGVRWRRVVADTLLARLSLDSTELTLDTLRVLSNVAHLTGSGAVTRGESSSSEIRVSGEMVDPTPLLPPEDTGTVTIGRTDLEATLSGSPDSVALHASLSAGAFVYGSLRASGADAEVGASVVDPLGSGTRVGGASLDLGIDRLVLPDTEVRRIDVGAEGGPDSLRLDVSALVDDQRRGTLHARVDRRPEGHRAVIDRLDLQLDQDQWSLADSAWVDYGATGGYALRSLDLQAGDQSVVVDGTIGADRSLDVQVEADSLDVGTITDLVGLPGVRGWLGGRTRLAGTLDRPTGWTYLRGALQREGAQPTPARIHLRSDGTRISGDVDLRSEADGHLRLDGSARIPGVPAEADSSSKAPLDVRVTSEGLRLSALRPVLDRRTVADLDGRLDADVTLGGEPSDPDLDGTLELRDGHMRLPALGTTWEHVVLGAHADGPDLVVDSARADSGPGSASLSGSVSLVDPYSLDLSTRLSSFQAIRTEPYHAVVSGQLTTGGSLQGPDLEGDLSIESLDTYLGQRVADRNLEDVQLTEEDLRMLRERFGYVPDPADEARTRPLADRLTADLVVHLGRDSWLRNRSSPELSVPFSGDVEVRLRPGEEPDLEGQVTTIGGRGFVEEFGRRFELNEGTVTFDGPPADARLDLSATYTIPAHDDPNDAEATIILTVQGTQESLDLNLSSEPPMENSDIVSYIATGRPAAGALSFQDSGSGSQNGGLAEAGANLALGQLAGVIESAASQGVGLDVVEIRREGLRSATLVAGKYVSPRVYVGFAQPVTLREGDGLSLGNENESQVEVEIEALRWLLFNVEGSSSALRFFLKGRYAY